jgi:hypothetical protein
VVTIELKEEKEMPIQKYESQKWVIDCMCQETFEESIPSDYEMRYLQEFKEYENYNCVCPHCGNTTVINVNTPGTEPQEVIERLPQEALHARSQILKFLADYKGEEQNESIEESK